MPGDGKTHALISTLRRDMETFTPTKGMTLLVKGAGAVDPSITDSYNVVSVIRTGIGVYQVTLTQATVFGFSIANLAMPAISWVMTASGTSAHYFVEIVNTGATTYNLNVYAVVVGVSPALALTPYDLQITDSAAVTLLINTGDGRLPPP